MVPVICPRGKKGFPEHVAREKLAQYAASNRPQRPTRVYLCQECDSWHLTSAPKVEEKTAPAKRWDGGKRPDVPTPPGTTPPKPKKPKASKPKAPLEPPAGAAGAPTGEG